MTNAKSMDVWIRDAKEKKVSWKDLPKDWSEDDRAMARLASVSSWVGRHDLVHKIVKNGVVNAASGKNCEQMIGELTIPLGVAGPLLIKSEDISKEIYVPLATTEGALIASVQRGMKATGLSGGVYAVSENIGVTRAPVIVVSSLKEGEKVKAWIEHNMSMLKKAALKASSHIRLKDIAVTQVGKNMYLRMRFDTDQAMGMNMATFASEEIVNTIISTVGGRLSSLSGNACVDKKPSWTNAILGRGMTVSAEVVIPRSVVRDVLKTTPEKIIDVVIRKDYIGSAVSGSMGFNGHFANMVAALFLATGQDIAHVVEGSIGITTAELQGDDLYFSVYLPSIMIGTVGGGTSLPVQHASLEMMGLGAGESSEKKTFAQIVGSVVLCGELSLAAALSAGDLSKAHKSLGRKKA